MSGIAIRVENLSKLYRIGRAQQRHDTLRDALVASVRGFGTALQNPKSRIESPESEDTIWALKDISFEVKQGEVLGIIGRNGAGKSTLLKILSRITEPTEGRAEIHGRVGSLLEVGTGFHPELTGRENIYLNGAILGMRRAEIDHLFDEIVAFSEIEQFLDTPVKRYSSGMYVRLAFAVAAHLKPEILLVDEVLAVGDAAFQKKCLGKMEGVAQEGRTVLFVSHNVAAIQALCEKALLLSSGRLTSLGASEAVIGQYLRSAETLAGMPLAERSDRQGDQSIRFVSFELRDASGAAMPRVQSGQDVVLAFGYESHCADNLRNVHAAIGVHGRFDEDLFYLSTNLAGSDFAALPPKGMILCTIPRLPLQAGRYTFNLFCTANGTIADWVRNAGAIEVELGDFFGSGRYPPPRKGVLLVPHSWTACCGSDPDTGEQCHASRSMALAEPGHPGR